MDPNIHFEESAPILPTEQHRGMTGWLIRHNIVATPGQATIFLIGLTLVLLVLTAIVIIFDRNDGGSQYNSAIYIHPDEEIE